MLKISAKVKPIRGTSCATETLLDNARALCDWILADSETVDLSRTNVELMLFDEKRQLTQALIEMVRSRAAELNQGVGQCAQG
jgi:hypothetical protein